jgi:hypothetical protein
MQLFISSKNLQPESIFAGLTLSNSSPHLKEKKSIGKPLGANTTKEAR